MAARTPVSSNGIGPFRLKQRQPFSARTPAGTAAASHTIDSSSGVRTTAWNAPEAAQSGTAAAGSSRHTASAHGSRVSSSAPHPSRSASIISPGRLDPMP